MYVAVKGGERAIANAHALLAKEGRGDPDLPRIDFAAVAGVRTTTRTDEATIIQTRHRIPETPLAAGQTIVYQVPGPDPLRFLEPRETETRRLHALADYGLMYVKLHEDIARHGHIATAYDYPVMVNGRYLMAPSPIPSFDNPKMHRSPALQLFGALSQRLSLTEGNVRYRLADGTMADLAELSEHRGDEGRPRHRVRAHRPGARRPAGRLHPAPRLLDPARMIRP